MKEYIGFISVENEICIDENYPIVRCKDCSLQDDIKYCDRLGFYVGDDGYCAWPKRREPPTVEDVLREFAYKVCDLNVDEREIAEKYMELPLDADGVPIHVGDVLLKSTGALKPSYGEVVGISDDSVFFSVKNGWESNWASLTRHYRKPTVEDVLREFVDAYERESGRVEFDTLDFVGEYAEKLREAMRDE